MNEAEFHRIADAMLNRMEADLERKDCLEVELQQGILTIELPQGKPFVVSKHAPTRQLWLSSPLSGGLHFAYDVTANQWQLPDGRLLTGIIREELQKLAGIEVNI